MEGTKILHYEIEKLLGSGGMGSVYKALDTNLNTYRALKFLHPGLAGLDYAKAHLLREARTQAKLFHPNIAALLELQKTDEHTFLVMEYVDGPSLDIYLQETKLSIEDRFRLILQIACALDATHRLGILHRDIKPANVLVASDGTAKVTDFGLAKALGQTNLTYSGETKGTAPFMAPELFKGNIPDERADVWALGVLAYIVFQGNHPFAGNTFEAVAFSILNDEPPPLSGKVKAIPGISDFIQTCLQKDPEERFKNGSEVYAALLRIAEDAGFRYTAPIPAGVRPSGRMRARKRRIASAVIAIPVILIMASLLLRNDSTEPLIPLKSWDAASGQQAPVWFSRDGLAMSASLGGSAIQLWNIEEGGGTSVIELEIDEPIIDLDYHSGRGRFAISTSSGLYNLNRKTQALRRVLDYGTAQPCWSIDGLSLIYQASDERNAADNNFERLDLSRIDENLQGEIPLPEQIRITGLPSPVDDLSQYHPVLILNDTRIAFTLYRGAICLGIWSIPAEGGTARPILQGGSAWSLAWDEERQFLLYNDINDPGIFQLRISDSGNIRGDPQQLYIDEIVDAFDYNPATGLLAIITQTDILPIVRIPFSDTGDTSSTFIPSTAFTPAISRSLSEIIYASPHQIAGMQIRSRDIYTGKDRDLLSNDPSLSDEQSPAPEPMGDRYLVLSARDSNTDDLYLYDRDLNRFIHRLTEDEAHNGEASWAADGGSIFFASRSRDESRPDLIIRLFLDRTGSQVQPARRDTIMQGRMLAYPLLSADGRFMLYQENGDSLGVMDLQTNEHRMLVSGNYPALSPDRKDAYYFQGTSINRWNGWQKSLTVPPDFEQITLLPDGTIRPGYVHPLLAVSNDALYASLQLAAIPRVKIYDVLR